MAQLSGGEYTEFPELKTKPLPISPERQARLDELKKQADSSPSAQVERTMVGVFKAIDESKDRQ